MHPEATHPATRRATLCCGGGCVVAVLAAAPPQPRSRRRPKRSRWHHQRPRQRPTGRQRPRPRADPARAGRARIPAKDLLRDTLAYADRALDASATTLAREMARLSVPDDTKPARHLRLALLLTQTRQPADTARALGLVQRTLADANAQDLHPWPGCWKRG